MQFDIRSNVREVSRWLTDAEKVQIPFATVFALTKTANTVRTAEHSVMKRVFNNPTPYAMNALQVNPATKKSLFASVAFKEKSGKGTPAKRFLNPEVYGGPRSLKSHERQLAPYMRGYQATVPGKGATLNAYGNIAGSTYKRVMSHLKVSSDPTQNISNSKRSKAKRKKAGTYFSPKPGDNRLRAGVWERKGKSIRPVLIFVRTPRYKKRFPFHETGERIVAKVFDKNFEIGLRYAMSRNEGLIRAGRSGWRR